MAEWGQFVFEKESNLRSPSNESMMEIDENFTTSLPLSTESSLDKEKEKFMKSEPSWTSIAQLINQQKHPIEDSASSSNILLSIPIHHEPKRLNLKRQKSHQTDLSLLKEENSIIASSKTWSPFQSRSSRGLTWSTTPSTTTSLTDREWKSSYPRLPSSIPISGLLGQRDAKGRLMEKESILKIGFTNRWSTQWREGLIVLKMNRLSCFLVKDITKQHPTKQMILTNQSLVRAILSNRFHVQTDEEIWMFKCPSTQSCRSWVRSIQSSIDSISCQSNSYFISSSSSSSLTSQEEIGGDNEEPVLLTRKSKAIHGTRSPPVTPPMEIYPNHRYDGTYNTINPSMMKSICQRSSSTIKNEKERWEQEHSEQKQKQHQLKEDHLYFHLHEQPSIPSFYHSRFHHDPHDHGIRNTLPPSPSVARHSTLNASQKFMNPTWPRPNYRFADTEKVDSQRHLPAQHIVLLTNEKTYDTT